MSTKLDFIIQQAIYGCRRRNPEALDIIFNNLPVELNNQVLQSTIASLNKDVDSLSWLCGYFASEINSSEDNNKPRKPIILLSKLLIKQGLAPFTDFMPYTGCRIQIIDTNKFEALPRLVRKAINDAFDVMERSGDEARAINDALLTEMLVD